MAVTMLCVLSCEDEDEVSGPPVVTEIRNYAASPEDTLITSLNTGQWVVLIGKNLTDISGVYFNNSVAADINTSFLNDQYLVVQVPSIPFSLVPKYNLNKVTVVNSKGAFTYEILIVGEPEITGVRNFADSPNDTLVNYILPGQEINIIGFNFQNATEIAFQGIAADLEGVVFTDTSAIVTVPEDLSGGDATLANTISITNPIGTGMLQIKIIGPPTVTSVSYEVPKEGDQVYLYGNNFSSIQSITFAGTEITSYEVSEDESTIGFIAPALTQSGPVVIMTVGGSFTSAYNVNDKSTGAISNFEWDGAFRWDWWGGASLAVEDASLNEGWIGVYPEHIGNGTKFLAMNLAVTAPDGGADWNSAVRITGGNAGPWFPSVDNLSDLASSWSLKFEINIPENWNGGTLVIRTTNGDYMARYEPWQVTSSKTEPYKTVGWQTLAIPLSSFRRNDGTLGDGKGAQITTINELFNMGSTTGDLLVYLHNYGAEDTKTGFKAAFDNFRVVRR